jgi:hypothetical protein
VIEKAAPPLVERLSGNPEPPARVRDVADRGGMLHDLGPPGHDPNVLCLRHRVSTLVRGEKESETCYLSDGISQPYSRFPTLNALTRPALSVADRSFKPQHLLTEAQEPTRARFGFLSPGG